MKVCIFCGAKWGTATWQCPCCNRLPQQLDGFTAFAPHSARTNTGFDPAYFSQLASVEASNFWFRSRNKLIIWAMQRYFPSARNCLEIGCGTGFVLAGLEYARPDIKLYGSEVSAQGLGIASARARSATFFQMDARKIPFENEFDVVGGFDVLEHIDEDELVLSQMHNAISPGGGVVLTVPHHQFLWSRQDEQSGHVRRYSARELKSKVEKQGFEITMITAFVSFLLPAMALSRLRQRKSTQCFDAMAELRIGGAVNAALEGIMAVELALIRAGLRFPIGGSLLLVGRKK